MPATQPAPTPTPFEKSESYAEGLAAGLALKDMIEQIPNLPQEQLQQLAWESIANLLLASQPAAEA